MTRSEIAAHSVEEFQNYMNPDAVARSKKSERYRHSAKQMFFSDFLFLCELFKIIS
jgi:hypothetical protein